MRGSPTRGKNGFWPNDPILDFISIISMRARMKDEIWCETLANEFGHSIETWALEEAKRRLQAEGVLPEDK